MAREPKIQNHDGSNGRPALWPTLIVVLAILTLTISLLMAGHVGSTLSQARLIMAGKGPVLKYEFQTTIDEICKDKAKRTKSAALCWGETHNPHFDAAKCLTADNRPTACPHAFSAAISALNTYRAKLEPWRLERWMMKMPGQATMHEKSAFSLVFPFAFAGSAILVLLCALARLISTNLWAFAINRHNRVSLSMLQTALWTILIVAGYAMLTLFNMGYATAQPAVSASIFPNIDPTLFALMGIALVLPGATTVIMAGRPERPGVAEVTKVGSMMLGLARADSRRDHSKATLLDLFVDEDEMGKRSMALTRVQDVLFTLLLLVAYHAALRGMFSNISIDSVLQPSSINGGFFDAMPVPDADALVLIGISHAAYLTGKFTVERIDLNDRDARIILTDDSNSVESTDAAADAASPTPPEVQQKGD